MCTPKIIFIFAPKIRIIVIKTSVTLLLVNRLYDYDYDYEMNLLRHKYI